MAAPLEHVDSRALAAGAPGALLNRDGVTAALGTRAVSLLRELRIFPGLDSTHDYLEGLPRSSEIHGMAVLAEQQWAGRGRYGRAWISPFGRGIYLSVGWEEPPVEPDSLTLRAALWCLRALAELGLTGLTVKWPNDLVHARGKFGGLLGAHLRTRRRMVLGVGLDFYPLDRSARRLIQQDQVSLAECYPALPGRCRVAGALLGALLEGMAELRRASGSALAALPEQFAPHDFLAGRVVEVRHPGGVIRRGIAAGIDAAGALRMKTSGGRWYRVRTGRVRLGRSGGVT